jgi:hypothetical protein
MTIFLLLRLILVGFNVVNAHVDAYRILKHKTIAHGLNLGAYLTTTIICGLTLQPPRLILFLSLLFEAFFCRQIAFDIPLNLRRGKPWNYVSPDRPPKALMDRIEIRIFGYNGRLPVLIYSVLWVIFFITSYFLYA